MQKRRLVILKRIVCCVFIACIGLLGVFMIGCNDEKNDHNNNLKHYNVTLEGTLHGRADERTDFIVICNSLRELKSICSRNNYEFFDSGNTDYNTETGKKIREYTNEYFEDKSLVLCAFADSFYSEQLRIDTLEVNNDKLTIRIQRPDNDYAYDVTVSAFFIVEIDKSFVSDVTALTYVIN